MVEKVLHARVDCIACSNGDLVFMSRIGDGRVYLVCEECLTGYWALPDAGLAFRTEDVDWESVPAGRQEVESAGWERLIRW